MPPLRPKAKFHRLPPILCTRPRYAIPGYSKAPRGLSVLSRVTCIFTGSTTSPGPSSRQCSDRYAIRAGRNLPDKEFRYLRTVIVTAAINQGFGSELRHNKLQLTPPVNLPALGRRQSLYVVFATLQRPVFLVNSRQSHFTAAPSSLQSKSFTGQSTPSSEVTGLIGRVP